MIRPRHVSLAARYLAHRFQEVHPYEVQALLLNACDLKCVYCRCPEIRTKLMTTDQWRTVIRDLGTLGTLRIKFQGGEPTLRADFRDLCAEAQRAGMITAVTTHGLNIAAHPDLLDHLDEVVVSLDSPTSEFHDRLRGAGTQAGAVRAIDLARERGRRTFAVMVVCRENYAALEPMLEFCERRGIRLHAQPVLFGRAPFDDQARHLALTDEQIRTMHQRLAGWKRQGRALLFSEWAYQKVAGWPDHEVLTTPSEGESPCMAGKVYVHIEANGDVWPCGQHGADFGPKNILQHGLVEALRHVRHHDCGDCFSAYLNERKALFGLRPAALLEIARRG